MKTEIISSWKSTSHNIQALLTPPHRTRQGNYRHLQKAPSIVGRRNKRMGIVQNTQVQLNIQKVLVRWANEQSEGGVVEGGGEANNSDL